MAAQDDDDVTNDDPNDVGVELDVEELDDELTDDDEDGEPDPEELEAEEDIDAVPDEDDDDDRRRSRTRTRTRRTRHRPRAPRSAVDDEEDEDDDLLSPDDVEADLDRILKDRMVTVEEEDEDEEVEPDERGEGADRLQPKRPDEQLCPSCFLLVRASAPACPVGDDDCPIFST